MQSVASVLLQCHDTFCCSPIHKEALFFFFFFPKTLSIYFNLILLFVFYSINQCSPSFSFIIIQTFSVLLGCGFDLYPQLYLSIQTLINHSLHFLSPKYLCYSYSQYPKCMCPICDVTLKRLDVHLQKKHGISRSSEMYRKLTRNVSTQ